MTMSPFMIVHIVAGTLAVLSGGVALFARKGSPMHRGAGNVFFASMLIASAAGAYVAFLIPEQFIAFFGGILAFYLVLTGWLTVTRRDRETSVIDIGAFLFALTSGVALAIFGQEALNSATGLRNGYAADAYFFLAAVSLLAAALDASVFMRRGLGGRQRIARHLWRMSFGFFIAAGSLFTGPGSKVFPELIRQTGLLSAPEAIIAILMVYWLVRVLFTGWLTRVQT